MPQASLPYWDSYPHVPEKTLDLWSIGLQPSSHHAKILWSSMLTYWLTSWVRNLAHHYTVFLCPSCASELGSMAPVNKAVWLRDGCYGDGCYGELCDPGRISQRLTVARQYQSTPQHLEMLRSPKTLIDSVRYFALPIPIFNERVIPKWNSLPDSVDFIQFLRFKHTFTCTDFTEYNRYS